jgi:hypothetical protein
MKKIRGDKLIGVIIHIYMEISQENSPCIYLYTKTISSKKNKGEGITIPNFKINYKTIGFGIKMDIILAWNNGTK